MTARLDQIAGEFLARAGAAVVGARVAAAGADAGDTASALGQAWVSPFSEQRGGGESRFFTGRPLGISLAYLCV